MRGSCLDMRELLLKDVAGIYNYYLTRNDGAGSSKRMRIERKYFITSTNIYSTTGLKYTWVIRNQYDRIKKIFLNIPGVIVIMNAQQLLVFSPEIPRSYHRVSHGTQPSGGTSHFNKIVMWGHSASK